MTRPMSAVDHFNVMAVDSVWYIGPSIAYGESTINKRQGFWGNLGQFDLYQRSVEFYVGAQEGGGAPSSENERYLRSNSVGVGAAPARGSTSSFVINLRGKSILSSSNSCEGRGHMHMHTHRLVSILGCHFS